VTLSLLFIVCFVPCCSPEAADAYLSSLAAGSGPGASLLPRSGSSSLSGEPLFCRQGSSAGSDSSAAAGGGTGPLAFPGWREVCGPAAERLLAVPGDMALMAGAVLPGVSPRTLAEVRGGGGGKRLAAPRGRGGEAGAWSGDVSCVLE
jgi:hypothetical protein